MKVSIKSKEVAEAIAARVEDSTGKDCEAHTGDVDPVIVFDGTTIIARVEPLYPVMDVTPVGGSFNGETVTIPLVAKTIGSLREIANATDRATSHVLSAAMHH